MKLRIANWSEHQHYKHRSPPWIKLHVAMIDEFGHDGEPRKFRALPDRAKMLFPFLLLVAARYDGILPTDSREWLARQTGLAPDSIDLSDLIRAGILEPETTDASNMLATCLQHASTLQAGGRSQRQSTETDTETDAEGDARGIAAVPPTAPANAQPAPETPPTPQTPPKGKQRAVKAPESASAAIDRLRPVYSAIGVDVDRELVKCRAWCQAHGHGEPTVRRLVNWLNRADKSIGGATPASSVHRGMHETIKVREL